MIVAKTRFSEREGGNRRDPGASDDSQPQKGVV